MKWCRQWLIPAFVMFAVIACPAYGYAQGAGTSSITGTVTDNSGGVIPGANVVVTDASGGKYETVSNSQGAFSIPSITPGTYKVTVTLQGFKTFVAENVRVIAGNPSPVTAKLEIGQLTDTVTVRSAAELVNTQNATVSSTLNADQLNRMPTTSRNALNAVTFLPGVNVATTNRGANVNGLPQSMLNITLDGVSNQDNFLKSTDGFFASVYPRQDAVESVTVTSAVAGANLGGAGAVTIAFTTRSGTNKYTGSAYEFYRRPSLNSNNWLNERSGLPKNDTKLDQYGARAGGPIKIPGLYDGSGKAFFFFHYEELRFPNNFTKTRTTLRPETLDGTFFYDTTSGGVTTRRSVNLMTLAAASGNPQITGAFDPDVVKMLNLIRTASQSTGKFTDRDAMTQFYTYQSPATLLERQPTGRVDVNITNAHRFSATASSLWAKRDPDYLNNAEARFPGAPNYRVFASTRPLYSFALRSTLNANMVNSLNAGLTAIGGAGSRFGQPSDPSQGASSFADVGGFQLSNPFGTTWWTTAGPSWRAAPTWNIDNSLSWQKNNHSFTFGGGFLNSGAWENGQTVVPTASLGVTTATCPFPGGSASCDPAANFFTGGTGGNILSASNTNLSDARAFYGMLNGRITSSNGNASLDPNTNQYAYLGPRRREGYITVTSAYAQDSWRMSPTVTLSAGARWDYQSPFVSVNDTMSTVTFASVCGLSGPGANTTAFNKCNFNSRAQANTNAPEFIQFNKNTKGYDSDWNNVAPNVSLAWRPNVQSGFLRKILGDPEQATLRGGYSVAYERQGISTFTGVYGNNPGSQISVNRNTGNQNLADVTDPLAWPVLYSQKDRLSAPPFANSAQYPLAVLANRNDDIFAFAPDTKIASARSWTIGFQRSISRDMAAEVRYVGTRGVDQWSTLNYNARDIQANGFITEFTNAVRNLKLNNEFLAANGALPDGSTVSNFKYYTGIGGSSPLPVYMAYLTGQPASLAGVQSAYTGTNWTSNTFTGDLAFTNPNIGNAASDLDSDTGRRANAALAGMPANFFVLNPAVGTVNVTDSGAFSDYNALQVELRRRLSHGLSAQASYQYALEGGSAFDGFAFGRRMDPNDNIRHVIKAQWDWTLPVGRGQRFGTNWNPWMDGALGGWSFNGVGRFQTRMFDFGNVRLVGMSAKDVQSMFKLRRVTDPAVNSGQETVYSMPQDVIDNTRKAFSVSSTDITGYAGGGVPSGRYFAPANSLDCIEIVRGDCGTRNLLIRGPWFVRVDVGLNKRFQLKGRTSAEVAIQVLNLLDNINFTPSANPGNNASIFQTTTIYQDQNNTYDPGGRLGQLMFRINW
jgi:hypothetical protein